MTLEQYLKPGDGVLDIGANVGSFAHSYARVVGPSGYVLAVEPDPVIAEQCREKAAAFAWLHVVTAAVIDRDDVVTLYRDGTDTRRSSLYRANLINDASDPIRVPGLTLDALATRVPRLRGIKIDAQGAEGLILAGARDTLQNPDLVWYVEMWPSGLVNAGSSIDDVAARFSAAGWQCAESSWDAALSKIRGSHGHSAKDFLIVHSSVQEGVCQPA